MRPPTLALTGRLATVPCQETATERLQPWSNSTGKSDSNTQKVAHDAVESAHLKPVGRRSSEKGAVCVDTLTSILHAGRATSNEQLVYSRSADLDSFGRSTSGSLLNHCISCSWMEVGGIELLCHTSHSCYHK